MPSKADRDRADSKFLGELGAALALVGLDALVVGNVASILHGAPVTTLDVDILVRDTVSNRAKLFALAGVLGGTRPQSISELTSTERIFGCSVPIDVLYDKIIGGPKGLSFASLKSRAVAFDVNGQSLVVASLEDVIKSKAAAGRAKDVATLPILRATLDARKAGAGR